MTRRKNRSYPKIDGINKGKGENDVCVCVVSIYSDEIYPCTHSLAMVSVMIMQCKLCQIEMNEHEHNVQNNNNWQRK